MKISRTMYIAGGIIAIIGMCIAMYFMFRKRERFEAPSPSPSPMTTFDDTDTDTETDTADQVLEEEADSDDDTELAKNIKKEKGRVQGPPTPRATLEHDLDPGLKRDFAPFVLEDDEPQRDRVLEARALMSTSPSPSPTTTMTMKGTSTDDVMPSPAPFTKDNE
jgi:hypothetical protein